jgi:sigma-B regulation protein RsbU (phosphoserine phosphatase)
MPAAMLMSNLQAAVKTCASRGMPPHELCERVNRVMCANIGAQGFISFFYAVVTRQRLIYCNAGHNPPIARLQAARTSDLSTGGGVLGVFPDWRYDEEKIPLVSGDRLLLYTDGITECENSNEEEFGAERLANVMHEFQDKNAAALTQAVVHAADEFSIGHFDDDLTVVAVSVD